MRARITARRWRVWGLDLLAGLMLAAGQAPLSLWPVMLGGLILSLALLKRAQSPDAAGWTGWRIGTGYFAASLHWIVEPFFVDAAATGWMAPFALFLMAGGLALFWALPFWAALRLRSAPAVLALWPLAELARGYVLTGFPWGLFAYGMIETPMAQLSAWIGPFGLTALLIWLAGAVVFLPIKRGALLALSLFALAQGAGWMRLQDAPALPAEAPHVRLVQPNAPQHQKWERAFAPVFFSRQIAATSAAPEGQPRPDVIIWPETAVPYWLNHIGGALDQMRIAAQGSALLFGVQRYEGDAVYNSLAVMDPDGEIAQIYDKHHLVPFGEYLPLGWLLSRVGLSSFADSVGGFTAGPGPALIEVPGLGPALPLICYEASFPQDLRLNSETRPRVLLHLTNDAWFGTWSGPYQHLVQAQFRAIEQGLPLLRSANTGVSAAIDAHGRVIHALGLGQQGYIDTPLPNEIAQPLYAQSGDLALTFFLIFLLAALVLPYRSGTH